MLRIASSILVVMAVMLGGARDAAAQPVGPSTQVPAEEFLVGGSMWSFTNWEPGRTVGGRYIRNVGNEVGVEAGLDVGTAGSYPFGVAVVQVRVSNRERIKEFQLVNFDDEGAFRIMLSFVRGRR